ncbi:MAG: type III-B CRISPR module RAMP protein Cmr1 [Bacteroidia bacterium]|nr:type III-B CRISPR module RAMP protein Cmr1 [Bacteroidia bacterium]
METITFTCKIITPMFLAGADGSTPELRAASIKGALRFWWRACNGHLGLEEMRKRETEIFGGVQGENGAQRSRLLLRILSDEPLRTAKEQLVPHKPFMQQEAFTVGQSFDVMLNLLPNDHFKIEQVKALFETFRLLGGIGKRVRRGMGSMRILQYKHNQKEWLHYPHPSSLAEIGTILNALSPGNFGYIEKDQAIYSRFETNEGYPFIKKIQLGRPDNRLLYKISNQTHTIKEDLSKQGLRQSYEASLGHAGKGRFASPVFVSVIETNRGLQPLITTLNTVPEGFHRQQVSLKLQDEFVKQLL